MYLEPIRKQRAPGDDPSIGLRLALLVVVAVMLFSVLGFRLWFLQILSGDQLRRPWPTTTACARSRSRLREE